MRTEAILLSFAQKLDSFVLHPLFQSEILKLIVGSGQEKNFLRIFERRLLFLQEHRERAQLLNPSEFERINEEIYSFHCQSKAFNIRVLYSFAKDGTILLLPFYEREGKRSTDYSLKLPEAERRKNEMEGKPHGQ